MRSVLFLCTGNTCRSIMAEAIARQRLGDDWRVYSAGVAAEGRINPDALRVLHRHGVSTRGLYSKPFDALGDLRPDVVVTVCGHAEQTCPEFQGAARRLHRPLEDPSRVFSERRESAFETTYREICDLVDQLRGGESSPVNGVSAVRGV